VGCRDQPPFRQRGSSAAAPEAAEAGAELVLREYRLDRRFAVPLELVSRLASEHSAHERVGTFCPIPAWCPLVTRHRAGPALRSRRRGIAALSGCIRQTRFLVLVRHAFGHGVIETIKDRLRGALEGEAAFGRVPGNLRRAAAANGPYVMSAASTQGRDASAMTGRPAGPVPTGWSTASCARHHGVAVRPRWAARPGSPLPPQIRSSAPARSRRDPGRGEHSRRGVSVAGELPLACTRAIPVSPRV
jgi:hypothetical protein